ncbi:MAG TPA: membrane protein insertion efficiency factor YidD [Methylotenera sp.]|nr:membrane protein insertion efficiency factor YidD [Methylotenera sp.]
MMNILAGLLIKLIQAYQIMLSPLFGQQCRFYPTCSQYAIEVINKHGAFFGTYYTIRRLMRCHPWHAGGHDPIP